MTKDVENPWDREADAFDEAPDHGLRDPDVRARWKALLGRLLPPAGAALDIGCGTGTLSLLMAELGLDVTGIDSSARMLELARSKAADAGAEIAFAVGDAGNPDLPPGRFDVVLVRHVLWALPNPARVLTSWAGLLRPGGRLVIIEGFWHTQVGLHRHEVEGALPSFVQLVTAQDLSGDHVLWGGPVADERFVIVAEVAR